ncbi:MAG: type II toxin-antitoxin system death-on-curing family toxin [Geminicoccaceae bacterium]
MTEATVYPPLEAIIEAHARLLDQYGGAGGIRNPGGIEAALARGEQLRAYADEEPSIFTLAAAIGYAFARVHHPFVDGNKRVAFYAVFATLRMNGWGLDAAEREAARVFDQIAAGELDETTFATWLEQNSVPL